LKFYAFLASLSIATLSLSAAEQPANNLPDDVGGIKKALAEMQQQMQASETRHEAEIEALKKQVADQQDLIESLQKGVAASAPPPLPSGKAPTPETPLTGIASAAKNEPVFPTTDEALIPGGAPAATASAAPPGLPATGSGAFPTTNASLVSEPSAGTAPITLASGGKSYLNISFDAMFTGAASTARDLDQIEVGDHDPQHRGFNARNNELALEGAVDPYFEGAANIVFKLDNHNETSVEVEEAFMQTTTLPWSLQLKGGQFFSPFGRINPTHPHTWDFADAPLVHGRILGSDGLRGVGFQLGWVAPFPWYSQLLLSVQNGEGNTGYSFRNPGDDGTFFARQTIDRQLRGPQDFVFVPRWENSFDLTPTQTLLFGISGAFGPNDTGPATRTQIYGIDTFYKWKPQNAEGGWPFVKWQSEAMYRHFGAGQGLDNTFPVSEQFDDWGAYSQVVWGFKKGWTTGLRGDYVHMTDSALTDDPDRQSRWRMALDLTFYPSEFSKIRVQYNHDWLQPNHFADGRQADSVFLQFEFALGAHGAHKY
jgi:hypothetical protein